MDKGLIKKCPDCGKMYFANKPHFMKSYKCDALETALVKFKLDNRIPPYEVWNICYTEDGMILPQYNHQESQRNFMREMYENMKRRME